MISTTVKIQGIEVMATQHSSDANSSIFVSSKEMAKVARAMVKAMGIKKASVRKSTTGSLYVTLPQGTSQELRSEVRNNLRCLEGESFDGMIDLASTIDRTTDDNRRCYFGSKYVFVEIKNS